MKHRVYLIWICFGVCLTIHTSLLMWSAWVHSPAIDEVAHLPAGISHWLFCDYTVYPVNPPLVKMVAATPVLLMRPETDWSSYKAVPGARTEFAIGCDFAQRNADRLQSMYFVARCAVVPFSLLGAGSTFVFARELFGDWSAIVASLLWMFSPNILANASMITPDVPAAAMAIMSTWMLWRYEKSKSWGWLTFTAAAFGIAILCKLTNVLLLPAWAAVILMTRWRSCSQFRKEESVRDHPGTERIRTCIDQVAATRVQVHQERDQRQQRRPNRSSGTAAGSSGSGLCRLLRNNRKSCTCRPQTAGECQTPIANSLLSRTISASWFLAAAGRLLRLVVLLGITGLVINLGYGFQGTGARLGEYKFVSELFAGVCTGAGDGQAGNRFANTWLTDVPVPFPAAMVNGADLQRRDFERGMWSFFAGEHRHGGWWYYYAAALLLKVPLGTLLIVTAAFVMPGWNAFRESSLWLLVPAGCFFAVVSSQTGFSRYLRYVLPASPFVMVWVSQLVAAPARSRVTNSLVAIALLASTASSLSAGPHWLSFFNQGVGGSRDGHHYLIDANVDWGQDLFYLREWCDKNRDARPLFVSVHSMLDPRALGVPSNGDARHRFRSDGCLQFPRGESGRLGWVAVSVHMLHSRTGEFQQLLRIGPDVICGDSIYVFNLDRALSAREAHSPSAAPNPTVDQAGPESRTGPDGQSGNHVPIGI